MDKKKFTSNCSLVAETSRRSPLPTAQVDSFKANVRRCRSLGAVQYGTFEQPVQQDKEPLITDEHLNTNTIGSDGQLPLPKITDSQGLISPALNPPEIRSDSVISLAGDIYNFSCNDIPTISPPVEDLPESISLGALDDGLKSRSVEKLTFPDSRCNGGTTSTPVLRHAISSREPSCPDLVTAGKTVVRPRLPNSISGFRGSAKSIENLQRRAMLPPFLFPSMTELANVEREADERELVTEGLKSSGENVKALEEKEKLPNLTKRQKLILVMMAFSNFSATVVFSCIAPFFPPEVINKRFGFLS